ncbi:glycoside hydrolase family 32 protein [Vibrio coralliilyticus]|uniref:glycoside hydrolase family 32 protein n=1 Tax=Vibrio coralliilyticus TaxID=190893 RepID=UPI0039176201
MSVESLSTQCGGETNITRVLMPQGRLIFAIRDCSRVASTVSGSQIKIVLDEYQVEFPIPDSLSPADLLSIGQRIGEKQRLELEYALDAVNCQFRPDWHISPPQGLLNDPNGFVYHDGQYHLFYQWYPHGCTHKDKYWAHLISKNLIEWQWQPVALTPSDWFDSHGVFSGHALSHGSELMLFYTGNVRIGENRERHTTQCLATSKDGVNFDKYGPVISELPDGVTAHIRDPKIVRHQNQWFMLLGAQTKELKGRLAVYTSTDLRAWKFDALYGEELGDFGYMWECPDMFELDGQMFVVIGPQGIESFSKHNTIPHHNGIAKACLENGLSLSQFEHLDYGFDFYAPQTLETPDGRRVMCGWMGLPDEVDQPSSENGWVHQLTCMRELSYQNGRLKQWPVKELEELVQSQRHIELTDEPYRLERNSFDLEVELEWGQSLNLFESSQHKVVLYADEDRQTLILDRSQTLNRAVDTQRELKIDTDKIQLRILADTSSIEVFVNHGQAVMTSRVFVEQAATGISLLHGCQTARLKTLKAARPPFA